tara:strand:- start:713 stop:1858 length:1146 start_codon:yes stop_codon:yes gene_type:complete
MAYNPFWQEDPRQQRGLFFSNAGLLNQGRGGGMPMGMTSDTTGPAPEQPQEDPMTTAMKMEAMYKGGKKGKKYIGDAWDWGKKQLGQNTVDMNQIASSTAPVPSNDGITLVEQARIRGGVPNTSLMNQQMADYENAWIHDRTLPNPNQFIQPTPGATRGFAPSQNIFSDPRTSQGLYKDPAGSLDAFGGTANIENTGFFPSTADPLKSGSISMGQPNDPFAGLDTSTSYPGLFDSSATAAIDPTFAGVSGSGGMFTPGTGTLNASTGVFTPSGGQLLGDAVGKGTMYSNVPKGAGGGMGSALGALGSAAGVGMNIYDMFDQGVTPGNMMGMLGSGMLGASALGSMGVMSGATAGLGLANAWNPIGWALLGGSIAGSLFDWW